MYHRVDDVLYDPWQLAVSPVHFEEQLRVLKQNYNPVSLTELGHYLATRSIPDRSVVLTFDDGYIDNFNLAKPLLEKYEIPATFFIATQNCEKQQLFWWDELQDILFETDELPLQLTLPIGSDTLHFELADEAILTDQIRENQRAWIAFESEPTVRCNIYLELWSRIRPLPDPEQQQILATLRNWANNTKDPMTQLVCMRPEHISQLISNPLFSVGAHTVTHPALADHPAAVQANEISTSKLYLEKLTGNHISLFAYPYGHFSNETVAIAEDQKFAAAVTTQEGLITKYSQPLRLSRYQVNNWGGNEFNTRLAEWFGN
ncbi:polysaccharide deacetylase family protein [Spirosoma sp. KNUC1025]|uniref:polysaccharide deacetylase family protein n=1 Tax=Spirosoma sp. KNUC1025 TaxID=2894082 RepID=UPI003864AD84|nr:polysaccharide deacetylase family protein [Spirosoma sp. KNUC1025]